MLSQLAQPSVSEIEANAPSLLRGATPASNSFDDLFKLLGNPIRRRVLYALLDESSPVRFEEVAELVHNDNSMDTQDAESLKATIHHRHLPTLEKANLVDVDYDNQLIDSQVAGPRLEALLDYVARESGWE